MPTVASQPDRLIGQVAGNGHCVAYVREVGDLPHTSHWRRGDPVRQADCAFGTVIATFDPDGQYGNHIDGRSHCAVLLTETTNGLLVLDQWLGQPVHQRTIRFRAGSGDAVNDGDRYYVVELADDD